MRPAVFLLANNNRISCGGGGGTIRSFIAGARIACRRYYYCRRGLNGPCTVERHRESEADGRRKIFPTSDAF